MTPHHGAAEGSGEGGHEQALITASDGAGNGAGGETPEAVGNEPFPGEESLVRWLFRGPRHDAWSRLG